MRYERMLLVLCLVVFLVFAILSPSRFLSMNNIMTMLYQLPEFGLLSLSMMVCILTGGINLSLSSLAALSGIGSAFILSNPGAMPSWLAILAAMFFGLAVAGATGMLNGLFIAYVGVTPILVTVGTKAIFEGIGLLLTKGGSVSGFPETFFFIGGGSVLGVPFPLLVFVVVSVFTWLLLQKSPWGERVRMIGISPVVAGFSGFAVKRILLQVYVFSALLAGIAAMIMISRYNSGKVTLGSSYLLQTVAATVLGGVSISGGKGKVGGVITATVLLQFMSSGMNILGVNRFLILVVMGLILIIALAMNFLADRIE
jgi:simple sugar transport system permease protein